MFADDEIDPTTPKVPDPETEPVIETIPPNVAGASMCSPKEPDIKSVLYSPTDVTDPDEATVDPKVEAPTT